jgi:Flp pilus assembly pilin Flp
MLLSVFSWVATLAGKLREERGQDFVEYAVIVGAIAVAASLALFAFGMEDIFTDFAGRLEDCLSMQDICGDW